MTAIEIAEPGGPEVLRAVQRPVPRPAAGEVLIQVGAAGVNRPDILQRQGKYAPPPGASDIPGLEVSGTVATLGDAVTEWQVGDTVMALVADIIRAPAFPDAELTTRKGEVVTSIRQDEDSPATRSVEALLALLYPDPHPYGFRIKGRIDLIERHASGALRVVDHKTGKPREPRPEMVGGGEVLQPALYGLAAAQELGERVGMGRLWYATNARNYETVDVPLNEWARRRALTVLERIDTAIVGGFLPAAPGKDGCKGCEYTVVCGPYEAERVAAKSQVELSALREMRGWR
jgi:CRISPR/Cas system-associated exonuclease Cas4 (RecB family)